MILLWRNANRSGGSSCNGAEVVAIAAVEPGRETRHVLTETSRPRFKEVS